MGEPRRGQGGSDQLREGEVGSSRREGRRVEEETAESRKTFGKVGRTTETRFRVGIESRVLGEVGALDVRPVGGKDAGLIFGFVEAGGSGWCPHGFWQARGRLLHS